MNFFPSKKLNLVIGYFISWICFTDFKSYQKSHFLHHLNTGLKNDPELPEIIKLKKNSSVKKYLIKNLFGLLLISNKEDFRSRSFTLGSFLGLALTQTIIYLILFSFSKTFPFLFGFLWIISSFTVGVFLSRLRGLLEHFPIKKYGDNKVITRSHYCNFIERFIFYGNHMNLHVEHHFNPKIPSYKLPQYSKIIKPYLLEKSFSRSPIKTLKLILDT
tara:strand:+ start:133 stop:783 length:651 start_codon:yes stop_codon:yes gene_type:complete